MSVIETLLLNDEVGEQNLLDPGFDGFLDELIQIVCDAFLQLLLAFQRSETGNIFSGEQQNDPVLNLGLDFGQLVCGFGFGKLQHHRNLQNSQCRSCVSDIEGELHGFRAGCTTATMIIGVCNDCRAEVYGQGDVLGERGHQGCHYLSW